jgi:preprotein translocase subunit SecY
LIGNADTLNKVPELQRRLLFTAFILAVYRVGVYVPTPGVNAAALQAIVQRQAGNLVGFFNLFSGGALEHFSIFTLGIMPYVTASIIVQLLTMVFPALERLNKEGEVGRRKMNQYTRYLTVGLAVVPGGAIATPRESQTGPAGEAIVLNAGWAFRLMTSITLTGGTIFLMWLGEQVTERGIGNGVSLIITAGILARMPAAIGNTFSLVRSNEMSAFVALFIAILMIVVVGLVVFFERAARRIPVQYPKRVVGRKVFSGQASHLPLRLNPSGVIPPIFASSLLMFPLSLGSWFGANSAVNRFIQSYLTPTHWVYNVVYIALIIFFCYFYTAITFNPVDVAENLKKGGAFVPGIRPGQNTANVIDRILMRVVLVGAIYISAICVFPSILTSSVNAPFYFGGTSLLICVGVALDTMQQIEGHLLTRHYDGILGKGSRIQGRRTRMR